MSFETRYDPIHGYDYTHWPDSKYFRNYRFSPPVSIRDAWTSRSCVWFPYYWSTNRLFNHYMDHRPSYRSLREQRRMIFVRDPISRLSEYRVYPAASYLRHKVYKPLSLYCDYYEPVRSLFWNSSYWPRYRSLDSFVGECNDGTGPRLQRIFDDETRLIRAQTASLLKRIHNPVPRVQRFSYPLGLPTKYYDDGLPARYSNDYYIHKLLTTSPRNPKVEYTTYYTEPVRKYIGHGNLSCVSYAGERAYNRRPFIYLNEDPLKSDIQLMSFYINKFRQEKAQSGGATITETTKAADDKVEDKPEITEITE